MVRYYIPSKTFLVGEYGVLQGGAALIAATQPEFIMTLEDSEYGTGGYGRAEYDLSGPALALKNNTSTRVHNFLDPHGGAGGFGASTAQYLGVYLGSQSELESEVLPNPQQVKDLVGEYQKISRQMSNGLPSGADLVGQWVGGLAWVEVASGYVERRAWPWPDLSFMLLRTGRKVATHEHLKNTPRFSGEAMKKIAVETRETIVQKDSSGFLKCIRAYGEQLNGLWLQETCVLVDKLRSIDGVLAAKGCGAQGADVVAVFFKSSMQDRLKREVKGLGLEWVADETQLTKGLRVERRA